MFCETWRKGSHFFENYQILSFVFFTDYMTFDSSRNNVTPYLAP